MTERLPTFLRPSPGLSRPGLRLPHGLQPGPVWSTLLIGAVGALVIITMALTLGPVGLVLPVAIVAAGALITRPALSVALLVATTVLLEDDPEGVFPFTTNFYHWSLPFHKDLIPPDALLALALGSVLLSLVRRREAPKMPHGMTFPLLLTAVGIAWGLVTAANATGVVPSKVVFDARSLVYIVVLPFLVVNVVPTPLEVRRSLWLGTGLGIAKGAIGVTAFVLGHGRQLGSGATVLAYYENTANFLLMALILSAVAFAILRVRVRAVIWIGCGLALFAFAVSFRRSFWIGLVVGLVVLVVVTSVSRSRRLAPILVALAALVVLGGAWAGVVGGTNNVFIQRIQSISSTSVADKASDRYRIDEQRNVLSALAANPITGLGLGVPWVATSGLSVQYGDQFLRSHTRVLWWWMKLGIAGLIAYAWLMFAGIRSSIRVWRLAADHLVGSASLAVGASLVGLLVIDLASSAWLELRFAVLLGAVFGWLATAEHLAKA